MPNIFFLHQVPNITEVQPDYGPVNGGTLITITGPYLDSGKNRKVTLDGETCPIQRCVCVFIILGLFKWGASDGTAEGLLIVSKHFNVIELKLCTILFKSLWLVRLFMFLKEGLLCSPRLHLFGGK